MTTIEQEKKVWTGVHDGVDFEINNFKTYDGWKWTYYLIVCIDRIPEESNPESFWLNGEVDDRNYVDYKYMSSSPVCNIDFHSGITYYSKITGFDGAKKRIKIGCDYNHYWDEGVQYDLEDIKRDVLNSIASFKETVPKYKYWCTGNGKLYDLEDGSVADSGRFTSTEWRASSLK